VRIFISSPSKEAALHMRFISISTSPICTRSGPVLPRFVQKSGWRVPFEISVSRSPSDFLLVHLYSIYLYFPILESRILRTKSDLSFSKCFGPFLMRSNTKTVITANYVSFICPWCIISKVLGFSPRWQGFPAFITAAISWCPSQVSNPTCLSFFHYSRVATIIECTNLIGISW